MPVKPILSIGMIFKNEIRCLERCMKSLQPLRDAIPCELIMADTGSTDGSREIAAKYADVLFDFPWTNDFSAARNAVMDRCSGVWYFSIDCDEWLNEEIGGFVQFLLHEKNADFGTLIIRNYTSVELERNGNYSDFMGIRVIRMSTGLRYVGAIHERWNSPANVKAVLMPRLILHHDGYVSGAGAPWANKENRNMPLLREKLKENPDDLTTLLQCMESGGNDPQFINYLYRAVKGVEEKKPGWMSFGPPIMRTAVNVAIGNKLPERDQWIAMAEELFSDNLFIRIDAMYFILGFVWEKQQNYPECIRRGEAYLKAVAEYHAGKYTYTDLLTSALTRSSPTFERSASIVLAAAYINNRQPEESLRVLQLVDGAQMDNAHTINWIRTLCEVHAKSNADTAPALLRFWEQISQQEDTKRAKEQYEKIFFTVEQMFTLTYREEEARMKDFCRYTYTLFLPLLGKCELGTAAAVLETTDRQELSELLHAVKKWEEFPIAALEHALLEGAQFPLVKKPLKLEEMDSLAGRLSRKGGPLAGLAILAADEDFTGTWQSIAWARGLVLSAVQSYDWTDEKQGMELCRAFAKIEGAFLPRYYAPELLCEENIHVLPPLHRFGWYCGTAFRHFDAGDRAGYVSHLREGLASCTSMKKMVEFLLELLKKEQKTDVAPELLSLAEQVRTLLSAYPADDPSVVALKESAVYQKVAHLIEGPDLGVFGGLAQ